MKLFYFFKDKLFSIFYFMKKHILEKYNNLFMNFRKKKLLFKIKLIDIQL
jgi:hypothetical protein